MATNFPTSLDNYTNPQPTDDVSIVVHSTQHANHNDSIEALEAKVGINGSADTNSLDYKVDQRVVKNAGITGATKTKITYDAKGLVTSGADATTADIADSLNKRYVTDAQLTVIGNTSGTNTGDQDVSGKADKSGALTQFVGNTAFRVFYSDTNGDITELALGADGTFLKSNGAAVAPSFATPAGSGDVSKVGTPVNNQIGVWTGDGTIEGDSSLTWDGTSFNIATAKNFQIAGSTVLADAAGTTTLSNIDALDATTESTIEAAIDTLANLTTIQGRTVTLADAGANAIFGWDDVAGAYENLSQAEARTVLGLGTAAYEATTAFAAALGVDDNYVTDAEKTKLSNLSGTNTGDQTTIVGITGTKAQFDTAVTDGNFLYVGDVTSGIIWNTLASGGSVTMAVNNGYVVDGGIYSTQTLTLPATSAVGDIVVIQATPSAGAGSTTRIAQAASQYILFNTGATTQTSTTVGVTGYLQTSVMGSVVLVCTVANVGWQVHNMTGLWFDQSSNYTSAVGLNSAVLVTTDGTQTLTNKEMTTIQLGHPSDTTLSRSSAGVMAVEGVAIPKGTGTANEIAYWSATNVVGPLPVATYPSLTELSYVKGVTSAIQTQLNAKQASDTQLTSLSALSYTGNASKVIRVNAGETDFELAAPTASVAGSDTHVQFNDGGAFGTEAAFTYQKTTNTLTVDNIVSNAGVGLNLNTPDETSPLSLDISAGDSTSVGNASGADVNISAGDAAGSSAGGAVIILAGNGDPGAGETGGGGGINIAGGAGAENGGGGNVTIDGGAGGSTSGEGGYVDIAGGDTSDASAGGDVYIYGGNSASGTDGNVVLGNPGKVLIQKEGGVVNAILNANSISTSSKTFTFPNASGVISLYGTTLAFVNGMAMP